MPAAGANPPSQGIYVLVPPPGHPQSPAPSRGPRPDPAPKIREGNPEASAPRRSVLALGALLLLSCLVWAVLISVAMKNQAEMREELELLHSNSVGISAQAWQMLQETQAVVQQHQTDLRGITELLCRSIADSGKCPSGWEFFAGGCYRFSLQSRSWASARNDCAAFDAHLAVLSSESEQAFLMNRTQASTMYWLGVTDQEQEGKWVWVTGEDPKFGFWDVWEKDPDKEHKKCGAMKANGRWTRERCSERLRWICEKSWHC